MMIVVVMITTYIVTGYDDSGNDGSYRNKWML